MNVVGNLPSEKDKLASLVIMALNVRGHFLITEVGMKSTDEDFG